MIANEDPVEAKTPTIFREILNSDLPPEEKSVDRLWHDAQIFNLAGSETTGWALSVITFYVLENPDILHRLKEELRAIVEDGDVENTSTTELEKLPFLVSSGER
jgi:cytochrome P450